VALLSILLAASCGRGSNDNNPKDPEEEGKNQSDPNKTNQTNQPAANNVRISGQLNIAGLELLAGEKGVLAFTTRQGEFAGEPKEVSVAADGTFSTDLAKTEDSVQDLINIISKPRDQWDYDAILRNVRMIVPEAGSLSVDKLKAMSDTEIKAGIADLADMLKKSGPVTVLVAYDKTGDRVAEAQSFRFISLPTPAGKPLSSLPNERFKGNVDLGKISGSKRDVTSDAKSTDAFDLSASALDSMADVGRSLKNLINIYMNKGWKSQPFYYWETTDTKADVMDKFSTPAKSSYKGYGFYIGSLDDQGLTYDDVCGNKTITFTPPAPITEAGSTTPVTQYSNAGAVKSTQGSNRMCGANGYYAREDNYGGRTTFMLNFGTGGSITASPKGLWSLKVNGQETARFDFDMASPIVDGKVTALIPRAKFITSGGNVTGVEVELYRLVGSQYEKVEDLGGFKRLVSSVNASVTRTSDNKESSAKLKISDDNKITGVFDSSEKYDKEVRNPPVATSDISSFAVYYVIANASYRIEFRN